MNFELLHTDPGSSARAGLISTDHGTIETPIFMPVGTVGSVKGVFHRDLADEAGAFRMENETPEEILRRWEGAET